MRRATLLGGSGGKEKARGSFGFSLESHGNGKTESSGQWIPVRHRLITFDSTGALLRENRHGDFTFATIPWTGKTDAKRFLFDERRKDVLVRHRTLPTGEIVASDTLPTAASRDEHLCDRVGGRDVAELRADVVIPNLDSGA